MRAARSWDSAPTLLIRLTCATRAELRKKGLFAALRPHIGCGTAELDSSESVVDVGLAPAQRALHLRYKVTFAPISTALGRAIAIACTLAFLTAGFAHGFHHFEQTSTPPGYELSLDGTGDDNFPPPVGISFDHCHGCGLVALIDLNRDITDLPADRPLPTAEHFERAHPPGHDNPPPIA